MNLLRSNLVTRRNAVSEVFRVVFYTTEAPAAVASPPKDTLRRRIMTAGDPRISIADVANRWVEEGRQVRPAELQQSVRVLRKYRRCKHALQVTSPLSLCASVSVCCFLVYSLLECPSY